MILGKYHSPTGIYTFPDTKGVEHSYVARWGANPFGMRIDECKPILEAGYDAGDSKWPKAILILTKAKWAQIEAAGFDSWVGLTKIHCFDTTVNVGTCPDWAKEFEGYDGFTIHEYTPGKVAFMRDFQDIYVFFKDSAPPPVVVEPPVVTPPVVVPPVVTPPVVTPSSKYSVKGKIWFMDVDLTVEAE